MTSIYPRMLEPFELCSLPSVDQLTDPKVLADNLSRELILRDDKEYVIIPAYVVVRYVTIAQLVDNEMILWSRAKLKWLDLN